MNGILNRHRAPEDRFVNLFPVIRNIHSLVALTLAVVYFLFQVEPFEEEFLENHRGPADELAFAKPSVTWETFDKSNAPKAFTVNPCIVIRIIQLVRVVDETLDPYSPPSHPVRDKSPPAPTA